MLLTQFSCLSGMISARRMRRLINNYLQRWSEYLFAFSEYLMRLSQSESWYQNFLEFTFKSPNSRVEHSFDGMRDESKNGGGWGMTEIFKGGMWHKNGQRDQDMVH